VKDTPETPETLEAIERWHQGKVNIFDEMARLETERNEAREDAKRATYDAAQETIKVSTVKSHWIEACRERDQWKSKFVQANKDYGFELRDPCGTIWDHAKKLQQKCDNLQDQRDFAMGEIERLRSERDEARSDYERVCRALTLKEPK
jgi:uncharacterized coiled-coil DUF342 family protein